MNRFLCLLVIIKMQGGGVYHGLAVIIYMAIIGMVWEKWEIKEYVSFGAGCLLFLFSNVVSFFPKSVGLKAYLSNKHHRPIGIGVQGLADAFILMRYPFESPEAQLLNKQIFETIYYGALEASCELAKEHGPYETYEGSPVSRGVSIWMKFLFCLWVPVLG